MLGFFIQTLLVATGSTNVKDADRDGVNDALEQTLIEHFRPSFHVSVNDCAVLPAAFEAHSAEPRVSARDGTVYAPSSTEGALEIHYYHLRDRDCGPLSPHELDVEHVSAPVTRDALGEWQAIYWTPPHTRTRCATRVTPRVPRGSVRLGPVRESGSRKASTPPT